MREGSVVIPLAYIKRWWSRKSIRDEKGGSFNMDLYLRICEIKLNTKSE